MIGVLTLLIESAVKLVPAGELIKQRRSDRVAEIGLLLFDLYRSTIAVAENGSIILRMLGVVARAHREGERRGKPSLQVTYSLMLVKLLTRQSDMLEDLIHLLDKLQPMIHKVDKSATGTEFPRLLALLHRKELKVKTRSAYFRPARGLSNLHEARGLGAIWLFSEIMTADRDDGNVKSAVDLRPEAEMLAALDRGCMAVDKVPWDPRLTDLAEIYVESGLGARRLGELVDCAAKLRGSLQSIFGLEDILLAHERRLKGLQGAAHSAP